MACAAGRSSIATSPRRHGATPSGPTCCSGCSQRPSRNARAWPACRRCTLPSPGRTSTTPSLTWVVTVLSCIDTLNAVPMSCTWPPAASTWNGRASCATWNQAWPRSRRRCRCWPLTALASAVPASSTAVLPSSSCTTRGASLLRRSLRASSTACGAAATINTTAAAEASSHGRRRRGASGRSPSRSAVSPGSAASTSGPAASSPCQKACCWRQASAWRGSACSQRCRVRCWRSGSGPALHRITQRNACLA
ncbi:hypothetical protein G6F50_014139 [Rhizopus delemar]|uniref:Uncharacterized protein n=1 Tax=Rhizopus delemar TaxID=936053 RepID=A0A9P7C9T8_9FUNG|nr:hypothetical protein G6F50_014139 [Rhizopus delemar]